MSRDDSIKIPHSTPLHHSHTPILPHLLLALLILPSLLFAEAAHPLFTEAEALFQKKNYKDAGNKYEEFIKAAPKHEKVQVACTQVLTCRMRMREFAVGIEFAAKRIEADKGSIWEARSHQRYGNLMMGVPHWGTRRGGEFHRADRKQGEYVNSFRKDRKEAIQHLEAARTIYFQYLGDKKKLVTLPADDRKDLLSESLNANFDLSGALLRRREHAQSWDWWDDFAERDEEIEDYEPGYGYRRRRVVGSTPPAGLRADKDGNPIFTPNPKAYDAKLPDDQRVRYLLKEIQAKDTSPAKEQKALSIYRQAMVARARFGPDRVKQWWQQGHRRFGALGQPIENDPNKPEKELWELKENEALTWVAGELRVIQLPPDENVTALLDTVAHEYSKTEVADDALYATGAFFQTRQQYPRAIEAYQELLGKHPNTSYANQAKNARKQIEANEIQIHQIGSQLTGEKAKLEISYRNAGRIRFTVQPIDLPAYLARITELNGKQVPPHPKQDINGLPKNLHQMTNPQNLSRFLLDQRYNRYLKLLSGEPTIWQAGVPNDGSMRPAKTIVETPVEKGGCYFVQAEVAGNLQPSRSFFVVSDLVILSKSVSKKKLYYLADATTGAPMGNTPFTIYESWTKGQRAGNRWTQILNVIKHDVKTNDAGLLEFTLPAVRGRSRQLHAIANILGDSPRFTFTGQDYWSPQDPIWRRDNRARIFTMTDRPVYRPKDKVRYKLWLRQKQNGQYTQSPNIPLKIEIRDARNAKILTTTRNTNRSGAIEGELQLGDEPPLGVYRIRIQWRQGKRTLAWGNAQFRVEEYKKPEFEVTVKPGEDHAKLGKPITADIEARYYFGAPVTEAKVKYKVFREAFAHNYVPPGRYDWLYGSGYGIIDYPYQWFPWWKRWGCCRISPPWYRWQPPAARELVKHGEAEIGENGKLSIEIDTATALLHHSDSDHRYIIEAEVTDSSRRMIKGSGTVSATRQSFYAYVNIDHGWMRPNAQANIKIVTTTPDGTPVTTKGKLKISEVKYQGRRNSEIVENVYKEFDIKTDAAGQAKLPLRIDRSGHFRISYITKDPWGGEIQGNAMLWVAGDKFDGKLYRFNDLEVLTDKREYKTGETAHVMINVAEPDSYVLFSPDAYSGVMKKYQLLHLPTKSKVIDIPIESRHEPNFHIEATTIRNARVHQMMRELAVPTERHFLDIAVKTNKPTYQPGSSGNLLINVRDHTGKPAMTELVLSVFDQSVLYIQPETTPKIEQFFHGQKRNHYQRVVHSLQWFIRGTGYVRNPMQAGAAKDWWGYWGPEHVNWSQVRSQQLGGGRGGNRKMAMRSAKGAAPMAMAAAAPMEAQAEMAADSDGADRNGLRQKRGRSFDAKNTDKADGRLEKKQSKGQAGGESFAEATVRTNFADTALWAGSVMTDSDGNVSVPITFPESLTTWKINAWGMSPSTQVGHTSASAITTKNLLVRLQAPRFFVERDEVILSANVHNYLPKAKKVKAQLLLPKGLFTTSSPATQMVEVAAGGEKRVDWKVNVMREGLAKITVKALSDEESDAMQMTFPVFVHGIEKQIAKVGSMAADKEEAAWEATFEIPEARKPEATALTLKVSPTIAGAMLDALPYLLAYPYHFNENTMSRFLPAIVTRRMLQDTGINLEAIAEKRRDFPSTAPERKVGYWNSPVFDSATLNKIINDGLKRLTAAQHGSGGWAWWSGGRPSVYQTCYVLYGLITAQKIGEKIDQKIINRGLNYIENNLERQYGKVDKDHAGNGHAYACYVLAYGGRNRANWLDILFENRDRLSNYGKALLSLSYHHAGNADRSKTVLQNIEQYLEQDDEFETAWLKTPSRGWWWWWNNDIETNAWLLRCYAVHEPKSEKARRVVKWLLINRRHGHYWHSTRDTAMAVLAFADYMKASGESEPDYELTVSVDNGALGKKTFKVNKTNMFFFDNIFDVSGGEIGPGKHTMRITKKGKGAAYLSAMATFFTREENIKGAGLELKVDRRYYRLIPKEKTIDVTTTTGAKTAQKFATYDRVQMKNGDEIKSGDLIEVELMVESKNDYDYLVFEDMKPAGCEAAEVRSGSRRQEGLNAHMELRDEKVVFFIEMLQQGKHRLRHRLRAEIPGKFHALPTKAWAMYAPDIYGTSDEIRVTVKDK